MIKKTPIIDINFDMFKKQWRKRKSKEEKINFIWSFVGELSHEHVYFSPDEDLLYNISEEQRTNRTPGAIVGKEQKELYNQLMNKDEDELDRLYKIVYKKAKKRFFSNVAWC